MTAMTAGSATEMYALAAQFIMGIGFGIGLYLVGAAFTGNFSWEGLANAALDAFLATAAVMFICSAVNFLKFAARSKAVSTAELAQEVYPPNNGAVPGTEEMITLEPGVYGRYGEIGTKSRYITNHGTSPEQLSLPPSNNRVYTEIQVVKPIKKVQKSIVAPWAPWNGIGGGQQYFLPKSIKKLIRGGYIKIG